MTKTMCETFTSDHTKKPEESTEQKNEWIVTTLNISSYNDNASTQIYAYWPEYSDQNDEDEYVSLNNLWNNYITLPHNFRKLFCCLTMTFLQHA